MIVQNVVQNYIYKTTNKTTFCTISNKILFKFIDQLAKLIVISGGKFFAVLYVKQFKVKFIK